MCEIGENRKHFIEIPPRKQHKFFFQSRFTWWEHSNNKL